MSNMNFNCDVCGREVLGCSFVNGMKFCAKCYQETFGETEKDRKIADLQSQLAEKEKEILDIKFMMRNTEQALRNVPNAMAGQRKRIDELTKELKQDNQDKISFALEQLEKAKENVFSIFTKWCKNSSLLC